MELEESVVILPITSVCSIKRMNVRQVEDLSQAFSTKPETEKDTREELTTNTRSQLQTEMF